MQYIHHGHQRSPLCICRELVRFGEPPVGLLDRVPTVRQQIVARKDFSDQLSYDPCDREPGILSVASLRNLMFSTVFEIERDRMTATPSIPCIPAIDLRHTRDSRYRFL
jgi:hypothetical protein